MHTLELIRQQYYQLYITYYIQRFIYNYIVCRTTKLLRQAPARLLYLVQLLYYLQKYITINYIVELLPSKSFEGVIYQNALIVIDYLIKEKYLILAKTLTTRALAHLFIKYIFSYYRVLESIILDRGSQFISEFQKHLCKLLGI